ncbi:Ger(x)C family spore germination protein [Tissierella sp. MB52-C2]|uniref:Ger(x)C family spore germination protein n=1 Tax=Tissierella sp. MB52-C2 TaxID=3070999 RepID=UPI00280A7EE6|nr:Ger(x)C family spore germination protein [Tissierella sp. MB52-C2]WMM24274.1 Ger(x)C family spore germination protein [Tissierella sp. MB52-C2]
MNKFFVVILIMIIILSFLTGRGDYKELEEVSPVSGIAVDKTPDGYKLTAEIIDIDQSSKEPKFVSLKLSAEGKSIFDCIRNMIDITAKKLYFGHTSVIIVSKDVARDGVIPILDFLFRDAEPRINMYMVVSDQDSASEILDLQSVSTDIRAFEIATMIVSSDQLSKTPNISIYQLANYIGTPGLYPVIPTVGMEINEGLETIVLSGGTILKKDKLDGSIKSDDIKYLRFVRNEIKGGLLILEVSNSTVSMEIFRNKTKVEPKMVNNQLSMDIKIKATVSIGEVDGYIDTFREDNILRIKAMAEKNLESEILQFIKTTQKDSGLDIFGFGNIVKQKMPNLWKEIESDWDNIFKELDIDVDARIHIRSSGNLFRNINKK